MERTVAGSEPGAQSLEGLISGGLVFEVARGGDDPALRRVLRENTMGGWINLSFHREPDFFAASAIEGERCRTIVARDTATGDVVGMFSRSVEQRFVNGSPEDVGYLSQLRIDPRQRGRLHHLRNGFEACRRLCREAGEAPFDLTTIVSENRMALRLLTTGLPGLPVYHPAGEFFTLAMTCRHKRAPRAGAGIEITRATAGQWEEVALFLQSQYERFQMAPRWSTEMLDSDLRCRGLASRDFILAWRGGRLVGCLALWDQTAFKQTVVTGYAAPLQRLRPLVNLLRPLTALPWLPPPGHALRHGFASHLAVAGDDPKVAVSLFRAVLHEGTARGFSHLLSGIAASHPLLAVVRKAFRHLAYTSRLFLVGWPGSETAIGSLDGRPFHVEAATL